MNIDFRLNGVDPLSPLLYRITIGGMICYIGCANSARRPKSAYRRNLQRMIDGSPYRRSDPDGFRLVHRRILEATNSGEPIVIELIRNVPREGKFSEERAEIQRHLDNGEILLNDLRHPRTPRSEQEAMDANLPFASQTPNQSHPDHAVTSP